MQTKIISLSVLSLTSLTIRKREQQQSSNLQEFHLKMKFRFNLSQLQTVSWKLTCRHGFYLLKPSRKLIVLTLQAALVIQLSGKLN